MKYFKHKGKWIVYHRFEVPRVNDRGEYVYEFSGSGVTYMQALHRMYKHIGNSRKMTEHEFYRSSLGFKS